MRMLQSADNLNLRNVRSLQALKQQQQKIHIGFLYDSDNITAGVYLKESKSMIRYGKSLNGFFYRTTKNILTELHLQVPT